MAKNTTLVTAFFDINRENNGDGRKISEYLAWIKKTLQLNCNLYIVTEAKFIDFMRKHRPKKYKTHYVCDTLSNALYYKYYDQIQEILSSAEYQSKISYPDRVECKLPEYNIIQYSKFGWLQKAIKENPFNTDYFFWVDAGISRFFLDVNINLPYPNEKKLTSIGKKFVIQQKHTINNYKFTDKFIWTAENLLKGTMFGGHKDVIPIIGKHIEYEFTETMLKNNNVNNEQLSLALVYHKYPYLFHLIRDSKHHLILFKLLSSI